MLVGTIITFDFNAVKSAVMEGKVGRKFGKGNSHMNCWNHTSLVMGLGLLAIECPCLLLDRRLLRRGVVGASAWSGSSPVSFLALTGRPTLSEESLSIIGVMFTLVILSRLLVVWEDPLFSDLIDGYSFNDIH